LLGAASDIGNGDQKGALGQVFCDLCANGFDAAGGRLRLILEPQVKRLAAIGDQVGEIVGSGKAAGKVGESGTMGLGVVFVDQGEVGFQFSFP